SPTNSSAPNSFHFFRVKAIASKGTTPPHPVTCLGGLRVQLAHQLRVHRAHIDRRCRCLRTCRLAAGLLGRLSGAGCSGCAPGGLLCCIAGLADWLSGGDCCPRKGMLVRANRVATNAVPVFMGGSSVGCSMPRIVKLALWRVHGFRKMRQPACQTACCRMVKPNGLIPNRFAACL